MEQSKNNELRRYFMWSLLAAIGFSALIAVLSPALAVAGNLLSGKSGTVPLRRQRGSQS